MSARVLPCPICGVGPVILKDKFGQTVVVCDNDHEEISVDSLLSEHIAIEFWNEDVEAFNRKGFAV